MRRELFKAFLEPAHNYTSQQTKTKFELIQCSRNYKNVPDASNRKNSQLCGGKKFNTYQKIETGGFQKDKKFHDSNNFDGDDELEQKMIEIAERQEKLLNKTLNFNFN